MRSSVAPPAMSSVLPILSLSLSPTSGSPGRPRRRRDAAIPPPPPQELGRPGRKLYGIIQSVLSRPVSGSFCLSVFLSVRLFIYLSISVCLSLRLSVCLPVYLYLVVCLLFGLFVCPSVLLSLYICLSVCLAVCLSQLIYFSSSICLSVFVCSYISISFYPSVSRSVCLCLSICLSSYIYLSVDNADINTSGIMVSGLGMTLRCDDSTPGLIRDR